MTKDLLASVVVFLVALPLCMGIAIASGVPPALGLITGIIGGIVVGTLSGSPLQVSGPAAGLAVLVWELVRDHGIESLGPVLLLAGALQLVAGSLRLGQWFRAMSPAVIYGMLAGIGVLIVASQFHVMLDDKPKSSGLANILSIPGAIVGGIFPIDGSPHEVAALSGLLTIAALMLWTKYRPEQLRLIPGALVGVLAGSLAAAWFGLPVKMVSVPVNLLEAVRLTGWEGIQSLFSPSLFTSGIAIAIIASAETLLSAGAVDRMQTIVRTDYDKELRAQGVGNMLCGFVGALPMTGVIVRSSANVLAGAQSRWSAVLHGVWILAFVAGAPWLLRMVPTSCLGAILVYTGWKLIDKENVRKLAAYGKFPVVIYAATLLGIVVQDMLTGVVIGVVLTAGKLLYKVSHFEAVVKRGDTPNRYDVYVAGAATFLSLPKLTSTFESLPRDADVHIHMDRLTYIDHSCLDWLFTLRAQKEKSEGSLIAHWDQLQERFRAPNSGLRMPPPATPVQS